MEELVKVSADDLRSIELLLQYKVLSNCDWEEQRKEMISLGFIDLIPGEQDLHGFKLLYHIISTKHDETSNEYLYVIDGNPVTRITTKYYVNDDMVEICYFTRKGECNKGYATRALTMITELIHSDKNIKKTKLIILGNAKSVRVAEKNGYTKDFYDYYKNNPNYKLDSEVVPCQK